MMKPPARQKIAGGQPGLDHLRLRADRSRRSQRLVSVALLGIGELDQQLSSAVFAFCSISTARFTSYKRKSPD